MFTPLLLLSPLLSLQNDSPSLSPLPPFFFLSLSLRLLSLIHLLVSFINYSEFTYLYSNKHGIYPLNTFFATLNQYYPTSAYKYTRYPTLYWLTYRHGDQVSKLLNVIGIVNSISILIGHTYTPYSLFIQYLLLNSTVILSQGGFPWESLLCEFTFIAIFAPSLNTLSLSLSLSSLSFSSLPSPIIHFSLRYLLFRLLFGFGKFKFINQNESKNNNDYSYLKGFLIHQPILSPIGYLVEKFPILIHIIGLGGMFIIEMIIPWIYLFISDYYSTIKNIAIGSTILLMIGIQTMGNFGYFNVLTIVLCISQIASERDIYTWGNVFGQMVPSYGWSYGGYHDDPNNMYNYITHPYPSSLSYYATYIILLLHFIFSLIFLPLNSWCSHSFVHWPSLLLPSSRLLSHVIAPIIPYNIIHSYGIFPPHSMSGICVVPVIEGSRREMRREVEEGGKGSRYNNRNYRINSNNNSKDKSNKFNPHHIFTTTLPILNELNQQDNDDHPHWEEYHYRYYPTHCYQRPFFIAPYHPRVDQSIVYEAMGISRSGNYASTFLGSSVGYDNNTSLLHRIIQRLLEGGHHDMDHTIFRHNPFSGDGKGPPKQIRVSLYYYIPTSWSVWWKEGKYYHRKYIGEHLPPTSLTNINTIRGERSRPTDNILPPEMIHTEFMVGFGGEMECIKTLVGEHREEDQRKEVVEKYYETYREKEEKVEKEDKKNKDNTPLQKTLLKFFNTSSLSSLLSSPLLSQPIPDINTLPFPLSCPSSSPPSSLPLTIYLACKPRMNTFLAYRDIPEYRLEERDVDEFFDVFIAGMGEYIDMLNTCDINQLTGTTISTSNSQNTTDGNPPLPPPSTLSFSSLPPLDQWSRITEMTIYHLSSTIPSSSLLKYRLIHYRLSLLLISALQPLLYPTHSHRLITSWYHMFLLTMAIPLHGRYLVELLLNHPLLIRQLLPRYDISSIEYGMYSYTLYHYHYVEKISQSSKILLTMMGNSMESVKGGSDLATGWLSIAYEFLSSQWGFKEMGEIFVRKPMRMDQVWLVDLLGEKEKQKGRGGRMESHGLMKKYGSYNGKKNMINYAEEEREKKKKNKEIKQKEKVEGKEK